MVGRHDVGSCHLVEVLLFSLEARLLAGDPAQRADRLVAAFDDVLPGVHLDGDLTALICTWIEIPRLLQRRGHVRPAYLRTRDGGGRAFPRIFGVSP